MSEERTSPIPEVAVEETTTSIEQNNEPHNSHDGNDTTSNDTHVSPEDSQSCQPELVAEPAPQHTPEEAKEPYQTHSPEQDAAIISSTPDMATHADDKLEDEDIRSSIEVDQEHESSASPGPDAFRRGSEEDESSSHHDGTDEDVFTDKSPRSSLGSYDAGSESGNKMEADNMTTITTRSPRISDISQYDQDEDFIPTARGTPRPPFRTPSDVRAMQMSSPTSSVHGSPRSSRRYFPTVSRLGTPSASAQYSPKRKSTPPRFKTRQEAPLVLLHVTLLPLRWPWGDLINNLDPEEMSEEVKTLRESWRILQDRVGDTVIERGVLLGHPQNDYEVLEERLLEALELPGRRRARILECGHYLGPSNESTLLSRTDDEESEDGESRQDRRRSATKRHWCGTCKNEIQYATLGNAKVFRIKVYASNGLMRAGAWEACWKEMERVDVEIEPIVEPAVQDEIVRLAAAQQEREMAQQEEAELAKEVASQYEQHRRSEERLFRKAHVQAQAQSRMSSSPMPPASSPPPPPSPRQSEAAREQTPEFVREHVVRESRSPTSRERDNEERMREIYGQRTPASPERAHRDTSPQHHADSSYIPSPSPSPSPEDHADSSYVPPPSSQSPPPSSKEEEAPKEHKENRRPEYQSASLPELLLQSVRVLMQDRKNVVIVTLSVFVLMLALRGAGPAKEPTSYYSYEGTTYQAFSDMPVIAVDDVAQSIITTTGQQVSTFEALAAQPTVTMSSSAAGEEVATSSVVSGDFMSSISSEDATSSIPSEDVTSTLDASPHSETPQTEMPRSEAEEEVAVAPSSLLPTTESIATESLSQETPTPSIRVSKARKHCQTTTTSNTATVKPATATTSGEAPDSDSEVETVEEVETATVNVTEKKVVKVVRTVTETRTQTQTETQTEVETATAFETVKVTATATAVLSPPPRSHLEEQEEEEVDSSTGTDSDTLPVTQNTEPELETETVVDTDSIAVTTTTTFTSVSEPAVTAADSVTTTTAAASAVESDPAIATDSVIVPEPTTLTGEEETVVVVEEESHCQPEDDDYDVAGEL
ncbi:hypothetical protein F5Y17DRAFT_422730 [Xylariaceae sp. FL0594]|nr:hypothetical protein F5Y17DRAFT_422730 [Xylariaceae sp. FL0594]